MIVCRSVGKSYGARTVLGGVDLEIGPGGCALLGPNGAGKSTLLRLLAGLERVDAGRITVGGVDMAAPTVDVKRRMGVVPERLGLFESLTVRENLECAGPIYGLGMEEVKRRADDLLRVLDLVAGQDTPARECSFGMRKKTALGMALLHRPEVLLLDEPFEGIDPASAFVVERVLARMADRGATVLLTSHHLRVVERMADRVLILRGGAVVWDSSVDGVTAELEATYFDLAGRPAEAAPEWLG